MDMFEVGGCIRDEILGVPSKDIDFTVVLDNADIRLLHNGTGQGNDTPFSIMVFQLKQMRFEIFLETPEFLTVRARFPKPVIWDTTREAMGLEPNRYKGLTADFVLARKEGVYSDGRRPDEVIPGTLEDDLARRDFTMNAIAKAPDGSLIDPFNGQQDIKAKVIKAVGDPFTRLSEDALRAVRALRFSVTKGFGIEASLMFNMQKEAILDSIRNNISDERIQQELTKMFRFDTLLSLEALNKFPALTKAMFAGKVSLDATMKQKGRAKT